MKRLILCLFFLIAHFLAQPSQGGPLRSLVRGCPGGVCPTKTIEVPVEAIVAPAATEKPANRVWGIVGYKPGPCPKCPPTPVYGWVEQKPVEQPTEKAIDEAASRLAKGGLSREEEKKLAAVIDAPALKKAIRQEWSLGSCGMICQAHGSNLYDVHEDGTVQPAAQQPAASGNATRGIVRRRR